MEHIDLNAWERREVFELFSKSGWPFVSVTMPVDVTNVKAYTKARGLSFYHTLVWLCTKVLNALPEFCLRIRGDDLVRLDRAHPSFTHLKPGSQVFQIVTLPWEESLAAFCAHAKAKAEAQASFMDQSSETDELIYFSCTPWFDFTALTNEHDLDPDDTIPRLAWGKYYEENGRLWVHLSIEVNHRTIDGFHLGQFKERLDREIEALQ